MRILIAVPTFENIYPDTFKSIYDLDKCGHDVVFEYVRGYDCATARNRICQISLNIKAEYVLMVDNDVVLPKNALENLLDNPKDVCLGFYAHRGADNNYNGRTCICKLMDEKGNKYFNYPLESEYTAEEMRNLKDIGTHKVVVHGGGMGCAFIKTSVFERLKYPWYDWVNYGDEHRGMLSEDLYFCERCKKASIPVYADTRVDCGHIMRKVQYCV